MEDPSLRFGPNGGLVFCMEYFANNFDWLEESLGHVDDDYVLFDCPGEHHHRRRLDGVGSREEPGSPRRHLLLRLWAWVCGAAAGLVDVYALVFLRTD